MERMWKEKIVSLEVLSMNSSEQNEKETEMQSFYDR
jgi:hypothetical protein